MTALGDRLALLLQEFRKWDPTEPCPATASGLAREYGLEMGTVLRIARSEGFVLDEGEPEPLELTVSDIEVLDDDPEIKKGSKIGRYELLEKLGEGGMGVVYVAYDPTLNRRIAIKLLRPDLSEVSDEHPHDARRRILREAQAMAQVSSHPNIVPVYDVGTYGERVFIAMEYVEGRPINDFIETRKLDWREIRKLYLDAAKGLMAAHAQGLVHRDFKPDNVLVDNDFRVKVMDFGLARSSGKAGMSMIAGAAPVRDNVSLNETLTVTGQIMGTPAYMAPEQFLLEEVDARADQFAFCVAMYEALCGYRPYQADSFRELARKVLNQRIVEPPRKSDTPEWIFDTILKGLNTKKNERWASMHHLCEALVEEPPHVKAAAKKKTRRLASIIVGSFVASAGVGVETWIMSQDAPPVYTPATLTPTPEGIEVTYDTYTSKQVHQVVMANSGNVRKCYREILDESPGKDIIGRIVVTFTINAQGEVTDAGILTNTFDDKRMADCVMASTLFWDFPESDTFMDTEVVYPFVFSPNQG